ncbi:MAG TPA: 4-alpha-glucanotransferase [Tepidisphaeraceae bacterium]
MNLAPPAKPLPFVHPDGRSSGVLLHVTSLPGPYGVGDLGPAAHAWVDQLAAAHQSWWQLLPLGPPAAGNSPYQCFSAFAGNPLLISPDALVNDGLLQPSDVRPIKGRQDRVNYQVAEQAKTKLLRLAWSNHRRGGSAALRTAFDAFVASTPWLDDYALFTALRDAHGGRIWNEWPTPLKRREPAALAAAQAELADEIDYVRFVQFLFDRQLRSLRRHAYTRGVGLIGDLPIFISGDSADVWANPQLFQLDRNLQPRAVAGVPPDAFSATGQRWNNPLYDWSAMAADGYAWWIERFRATFAQTDAVRLDHFRGFDAYWRIPASAPTAQTGRWVDGPGAALFEAVKAEFGHLPLIAEDLGVITDRVNALREGLKLPGMRVVQFGFGGLTDSIHLPHRYTADTATYPGTHDNDTTVGWFKTLTKPERRRFTAYIGDDAAAREPAWALIRLAWASVAALAITPLQDVLSLPTTARMNLPGVGHGNWRWRANDEAGIASGLERLSELTTLYARV